MILESIYQGSFSPCEMIRPENPEYSVESHKVYELQDAIMERLDKDGKKLLEQMVDRMQSVHEMENKAYFKMGFALGTDLQDDVREQLGRLQE